MSKCRLIPKLEMKASAHSARKKMVLVTTVGFQECNEVGDPVSQAKIYQAQAADELIFLDLDSTMLKLGSVLEVVERSSAEIFMPFTVGGGVKSLEDFRLLLSHGADKVSVNSAAVENPNLINKASAAFGAQCVVLSIDYRRERDGSARVYTHGGKVATRWDPVNWAIEGEKRGAGEILITSIDRDGTRSGLDLEITKAVNDRVSVPVITSGGCGSASHFIEGFRQGVSAVSAGTYFCFKDENPMQCRSQIKNAGFPIRIVT